jgi:pimeloyl-ACP methyl ester carboxylesterase
MSDRAGRRRREFGSREEAADHFRGRGAFTGWVEEALQGYVRDGLIGDGPVRLACDPEVEADVYRGSGAHHTWDHLQAIEIPVLVMSGAESDTVTPGLAHEQAGRLVRGGVEVVPGAGHFLPMENPGLVAERVRRLVEAVGSD